MTETYGTLTVGAVTSGTVAVGEQVTGARVHPGTAIIDNLSGSGPGSTWVVDAAQTVAGDLTMTAPLLNVAGYAIAGATQNHDFLEIQPNGSFGFDYYPSSLSYMSGTAAAALGLTQASGAVLSSPGGQPLTTAELMNDLVSNVTSQFGSLQSNYPEHSASLAAWAQSTYGLYQFLNEPIGTTPPAGSSLPTIDPAGTYSGPGASAPTTDPAGTYSLAGASAPTTDLAGTYSSPGASAATQASPGYYVPTSGASAEKKDPAGTYSSAGASAPTTDPAGTYSPAGASAPTTDPAGTYSAVGASAPTLAAAGTYIPVTGSTSAAAQNQDPAGTYSGPGASAPSPADPGTYISFTGATSEAVEIADPAGTYSQAGASAPTTDPAGTYSPAGASAPTTDPAGTYSYAGASAPTPAQPGYYVPTPGASSETPDDPGYYTPYAGATAEILALPPIISNTRSGQSTASGQPAAPFASVTISDPNIDTTDSLSVQVAGAGGTLADGAGFSGLTTSAPGVYLLSGTAAAITSELDALVFTPSAGAGTTTLTLTDTTSVETSASDANTTLTVLSGGPPVVSVTTFLADQPTLDKIVGGFDISDTAANLSANLGQLNDPNIDAITISDDGQVSASVQQLTSDATAIGILQDASASPVLLAINDFCCER